MYSHGDVKPDNIVVDPAEPDCPATLIDFALAFSYMKGECSWHREEMLRPRLSKKLKFTQAGPLASPVWLQPLQHSRYAVRVTGTP